MLQSPTNGDKALKKLLEVGLSSEHFVSSFWVDAVEC